MVHSPPCENSEWSGRRRSTFWMAERRVVLEQTGAFLLGTMLARGLDVRSDTCAGSLHSPCTASVCFVLSHEVGVAGDLLFPCLAHLQPVR